MYNLEAHDIAEIEIYEPLRLEKRTLSEIKNIDVKKLIVDLMMDRANNQFKNKNIEFAIEYASKTVALAETFLSEDSMAYYYGQYARILDWGQIGDFFKAEEFYKRHAKIKGSNISKSMRLAIKDYNRLQAEIKESGLTFPEGHIPRGHADRVIFQNELVYKILKTRDEVTIIDIVDIDKHIKWVNENLDDENQSRFYCNLGRILFLLKKMEK